MVKTRLPNKKILEKKKNFSNWSYKFQGFMVKIMVRIFRV